MQAKKRVAVGSGVFNGSQANIRTIRVRVVIAASRISTIFDDTRGRIDLGIYNRSDNLSANELHAGSIYNLYTVSSFSLHNCG